MARREPPPILTVPVYLRAVRSLHALGVREIARGLHVSPSVVRRWLAGTLVPGWRRMKAMTALWGGDAVLLALGAALQRYCRTTGVALEDALRLVRSGRAGGRARLRRATGTRDRRQLSLPIAR